MAAIYVNNIIINIGSDFSQTFVLEGVDTNSPLDLTGYTASAQIRKWSGSSSAINFTVEIISPETSGLILLRLTNDQTSNIKPGRYLYDVVITDQFHTKNRVIEGMVLAREGVTR